MELLDPSANAADDLTDPRQLLESLLAQQAQLTAVDAFSRAHATNQISQDRYRQLLPATAPRPGEQYAFEVDLDKCSGCKACVTACHSLNGLDEEETWRTVGLLVSPPISHTHTQTPELLQHVTTACHHCVDPGCLSGCPVLAYDKDPITGIVRHLDDQCIGCQYCVMKCSYDAPKYSHRLGIVRKCDMCSNRLAVGEAPACAQACPNEAIKITLVDQAAVRAGLADNAQRSTFNAQRSLGVECCTLNVERCPHPSNSFLPDTPPASILNPTTRYLWANAQLAQSIAADHAALRLDQPHWPLVLMLVLTQAAAGVSLVGASVALSGANLSRLLPGASLALLVLGLSAAVLHLGQPLKAWRSFLGWRRSWLSREIIAFQIFAGTAAVAWLQPTLTPLAALMGLLAVATSAMVYVDTHRPFWSAKFAFGNFFGTTLLLGATGCALLYAGLGDVVLTHLCALAALAVCTALFVWRRLHIRQAKRNSQSPIHLNARLVHGPLLWTQWINAGLFLASTVFGLLALTSEAAPAVWFAAIAATTISASEIIARFVFFVAGTAKRMPGGVAA